MAQEATYATTISLYLVISIAPAFAILAGYAMHRGRIGIGAAFLGASLIHALAPMMIMAAAR